MASGRNNKLVGQVGEFLVCAELGRLRYIATPFSGNVPGFDVIATDEWCRSVPIQVKTSDRGDWRFDVRTYLKIRYDARKNTQSVEGLVRLKDPSTVFVLVKLARAGKHSDRFFIMTRRRLQNVTRRYYTAYLRKHNGRRPKKPESFHMAIRISDVKQFEGNWQLITKSIKPSSKLRD